MYIAVLKAFVSVMDSLKNFKTEHAVSKVATDRAKHGMNQMFGVVSFAAEQAIIELKASGTDHIFVKDETLYGFVKSRNIDEIKSLINKGGTKFIVTKLTAVDEHLKGVQEHMALAMKHS